MMRLLRKAADAAFNAVTVGWYARNGYRSLFQTLGGGSQAHTGEAITVERAMQCSAVYVATRMICESVASMPLPTLQRMPDGETRLAKDISLYRVLKNAPNNYQTPKVFRRTLTHHALNYGNGYARIIRRGGKRTGEVIGLHILHPSCVTIQQESETEIVFLYTPPGKKEERFTGSDIFHLPNVGDDGIKGLGAVALGKQAIAQCLALEQYGSRFFARGGVGAGMLKKMIPFKDDASRKMFREDLEKTYAGMENAHKTIITEGDWDFKPFSSDPEKAQFVAVRQFMIPEVLRYYSMSPHLAGDLSRATFSNIEHLGQEFVTYTLMPWMLGWEQEIHRSLLTPAQQDAGYYAKHNANALLRGDFETRWKGYATALQNGVNSINEVRALEDLDPIEGGDAHHIQLNMQTVAGTGDATAAQQAQLVKVSAGKARRN